jgi:transcriptional regulator with XRE-family HTH domain
MDIIEDGTDNPEAQTVSQIAQRVRLERDLRNWSLAELAERSGVSKPMISKIERKEVSPTAAILARLAAAFDLTLATLLLRAEGGPRLSRAAAQPIWRDPATGYMRKQVFSRSDHPLELVEVELPAGQKVSFPAWSYAHIRQIVWVRKGRLVLSEANARHELRAGDCLGFGPPSAVTFANESETSCSYVVALARS